jgi:hypothetical protein
MMSASSMQWVDKYKNRKQGLFLAKKHEWVGACDLVATLLLATAFHRNPQAKSPEAQNNDDACIRVCMIDLSGPGASHFKRAVCIDFFLLLLTSGLGVESAGM